MRVAVVGAGIAGLAAAWRLHPDHEVTVFEAEPRIGGHAWTVDIPLRDGTSGGGTWPIDVGFQLWHPRVNPNLAALMAALGVAPRPIPYHLSSVRDGAVWTSNGQPTAMGAWFADEVARFSALVVQSRLSPLTTFRTFLSEYGFSDAFVQTVLAPLLSFWWVSRTGLLDTPVTALRYLFEQGVLSFSGPTTWCGVEGGSRETCEALSAGFADRLRLGQPVDRIERPRDGVTLRVGGASVEVDQVVLAVDGVTALRLLAVPTPEEESVLGGVRVIPSTLRIHRDPSVMPVERRHWSYGNYLEVGASASVGELPGMMTYAPQPPAGADPIFVTVGEPPTPLRGVLAERTWCHVVFDEAMIKRRFGAVQGKRRTWFCGGHCVGFPVHEMALVSGLAVAHALGATYPFADDPSAATGFSQLAARALGTEGAA